MTRVVSFFTALPVLCIDLVMSHAYAVLMTLTLQTLIDSMRSSPFSRPTPRHYITTRVQATSSRTTSLKQILHYKPGSLSACLIGEAGLQLAHLAHECIDPIEMTFIGDLDRESIASVLEGCVPETAVKLVLTEVFKGLGLPEARFDNDGFTIDYSADRDELCYRFAEGYTSKAADTAEVSLWALAEYLYCFATPALRIDDRVAALVRAAHVFGLQVTDPQPQQQEVAQEV